MRGATGSQREDRRGQAYEISWTKWASTSSTQEALPPSRPIGAIESADRGKQKRISLVDSGTKALKKTSCAKRGETATQPHEKKAVIEDYLTAKTIYTQKAEIAQTESWKEYCTTQDKESMWDKVYRVIRNKKGRLPDTLLRNSEGKTLSPHESAKLLANTFYPDDSVSTDMPFHIRTRERIEDKPVEDLRLSKDDPPFTRVELKAVLRELNPKKAPGPDGLTADICIAAIESEMEVFSDSQ
ncbi:hypothetical protein EVAR_85887_1 [Eumeta japonica]|uniref:Retrovirus-related Pol polyprotein from type-1 retrotransposable element R1 n=1 Tax=Eumeta variegata TaxID=151549 RepID=A0A4C2A7K0_EUMVA|nr:hypothetical protein EVAR_85887_1 [Eumeta japonica]